MAGAGADPADDVMRDLFAMIDVEQRQQEKGLLNNIKKNWNSIKNQISTLSPNDLVSAHDEDKYKDQMGEMKKLKYIADFCLWIKKNCWAFLIYFYKLELLMMKINSVHCTVDKHILHTRLCTVEKDLAKWVIWSNFYFGDTSQNPQKPHQDSTYPPALQLELWRTGASWWGFWWF